MHDHGLQQGLKTVGARGEEHGSPHATDIGGRHHHGDHLVAVGMGLITKLGVAASVWISLTVLSTLKA